MLRNYIKIAFRNLWKHKLFSFINIFGLAAGMAISILALIDLKSAFDYDKFHPYPERTFEIITDQYGDDKQHFVFGSTPTQVAPTLAKYNFIEESVQVYFSRMEFSSTDEKMPLQLNFVNPAFFRVFNFKMRKGTLSSNPFSIVLTADAAIRYFGAKNPIGKVLKQENGQGFTVTGILAEPAGKSHLEFEALASGATIPLLPQFAKRLQNQSDPMGCMTYVLLKEGTSASVLDNVLPGISKSVFGTPDKNSHISSLSFRSVNLAKITPSNEENLVSYSRSPAMGKILAQVFIGFLILFLAGFNYVNLTLARSLTRAREVGVRKVMGAMKWQLVAQFVTESVVISVFALLLSFAILQLMRPLNVVREIFQNANLDATLLVFLLAFAIAAGVLAGLAPAKILSALNTISSLKGNNRPVLFKGLTLRKILVVAQFSISLTGIIFMLVMYNQQKLMSEFEYGFNRLNIINIRVGDADQRILSSLVRKQAGVEQVTAVSHLMGMNSSNSSKIKTFDKQGYTDASVMLSDAAFVPVMGLKLLAGENLPESVSDSSGSSVLLNEKATAGLHFKNPEDAVGQMIWLNDSTQVRVAGIIQDFHTNSALWPLMPLVVHYQPKAFKYLQVKVSSSVSSDQYLEGLSKSLASLVKGNKDDIQWFDKTLYDAYSHVNDQLLLAVITGMVLSIACLGLLGMVTYTSEIRTKEIGIRKVMGAGVSQLVLLLSKDFLMLLGISALIAFPSGFIAGTFFLLNFTYHISIGPGIILIGFFVLLAIGGLTIGWQTFKTAVTNPVNSLRNE